jgi:uncharacterized protein
MLNTAEFAALESLLDGLRQRLKVTPCWEFCEGFMAALICCRRQIAPDEYLPVLLTTDGVRRPLIEVFASAAEQQRFVDLWLRRWQTVVQALDTQVKELDDPAAYQPELQAGPSFAQLWALGFMAAVKAWPEEWAGPRNKAAQQWRSSTLDLIVALTQEDTAPLTLPAFADVDPGAPHTVSIPRMTAFADALWAVYNMRDLWRQLGLRIATHHAPAAPGRNDPCHCGSGRKFKKCCAVG